MFATLGLQMIAVFTTFRGAMVFFEGIHWTAPLFFTAVLVFMFWVMANTAFSKRRRLRSRGILLAILFVITTFLSYVGISNAVIRPQDRYHQQYELFAVDYNRLLELLVIETPTSDYARYINNIYNDVSLLISLAEREIYSLNEAIAVTIQPSFPGYGTDPETGAIISRPVPNPYFGDALERRNQNIARRNSIAAILDTANPINPLENNPNFVAEVGRLVTEPDRRAALAALEENFTNEFQNYADTVRLHNSLQGLIGSYPLEEFSPTLRDVLSAALVGWNMSDYLSDLELIPFVSTTPANESEPEDSIAQRAREEEIRRGAPREAYPHIDAIYSFLLQGTESPVLSELIYHELRNEVELRYAGIQRTVNALPEEFRSAEIIDASENLTDAKEDLDSNLQSPFVFAISRLSSSERTGLDIIILLVAIVVDGLTMLIPLTAEKRRDSVLFTESSNDLRADQEDILEKMLLSIFMQVSNTDRNGDWSLDKENEMFRDMLKKVSDYINSFSASPCTQLLGYPIRKKVDLDNPSEADGGLPGLTTLLLEMGYIKYVSTWEYSKLEKDYHANGEVWKDNDSKDENPRNGYYLMKRQFVMWMNDNQLSFFSKL